VAVHAGKGSSLNKAIAVGVGGERIDDATLDELEEFLEKDGSLARVELTPFTHRSLAKRLARRKYGVVEWSHVLVRALSERLSPVGAAANVDVTVTNRDHAKLWATTLARSYMEEESGATDEEIDLALPMTATSSLHCFLARAAGEAVGAAVMGVHDGVASLFGAAVMPDHRERGAHRALIQARLEAAIEYGCDVATCSAPPCSGAERNLERWGFKHAYAKVVMQRAL
jgi:ribosomal protein S18 acetylase RimI-like enzyme